MVIHFGWKNKRVSGWGGNGGSTNGIGRLYICLFEESLRLRFGGNGLTERYC